MKLDTITAILTELYETREELSKNKFSGVYFVKGVYRVHVDSFIPRVFSVDKTIWDDIAKVVDVTFSQTMEWDQQTLWLTMKDSK
jgi:hypothetical protein